jgi:hypothetical protein
MSCGVNVNNLYVGPFINENSKARDVVYKSFQKDTTSSIPGRENKYLHQTHGPSRQHLPLLLQSQSKGLSKSIVSNNFNNFVE